MPVVFFHINTLLLPVCATVQAMGYSKAKAKEALEESGGDLEGAVMFLVSSCT